MPSKYLNEHCACKTFDSAVLKTKLESDGLLQGLYKEIVESRPNLFSATTVFLSSKELEKIKETIKAIEETILNPFFQEKIFKRSSEIAKKNQGTSGVFMGYDFHLGPDGPKLIEVNTNAGGALLNLELARAQQDCCQGMEVFFKYQEDLAGMENTFIEMFKAEWQKLKGHLPMGLIAIVDDNPLEQYLYPEFQLFQRLFTKFGIESVIVDPLELSFKKEKLWYGEKEVQMVYNRLTDFYLKEPAHASLRKAFMADAIVLTPSPYHHALYAHKLNLVDMTSKECLTELKVRPVTQDSLLSGIPITQEVSEIKAAQLWELRKSLFFKPVAGFGSKATYRGEKITRKVWEEILNSSYVAQELIAPGRRKIKRGEELADLKFDVRAYTYQGEIQIIAARLYSGQTTNFRTAGGGFAPVFVIKDLNCSQITEDDNSKRRMP